MYKILKENFFKRIISTMLLFNLIFSDVLYAGNIIVNSGGTTVDKTANGIDLVNIADPNSKGISHNDFEKYNVDKKGVILNNSQEVGISQLGGLVNNNPNLTNNAKIIIAEVSGSEKSNIEGYTEVFGQSADFILANPNGIYVNGAGFINIPNLTLTTGNVKANNGSILFGVQGGEVSIGAQGIDLSNTSYFEIISRTAKLSGKIYGDDEVRIVTGTNEYNYEDKTYEAIKNSDEKPEVAIDASALGGIYAGRIELIGTEEGVGVKSESELVADAGDIVIDSNGNLVLKDVYAKTNAEIKGNGKSQLGKVNAGEKIVVSGENNDLEVGTELVSKSITVEATLRFFPENVSLNGIS